jgi:hypothetical protein
LCAEFYDNVTVTPKQINITRILISGTYRKTNIEWYRVIEFNNIYLPFVSSTRNISIRKRKWLVEIITHIVPYYKWILEVDTEFELY